MADITNRDDIIDSRDVEEAIDDLESEQAPLIEEYEEAQEEADEEGAPTERLANAINALSSFWDITPEEVADSVAAFNDPSDDFNGLEELHSLKELREAFEDYTDWRHGVTLIRETYFEEYAKELASDIGAIKDDESWPYNHIDWEAAAEALKMDYTSAEYDGVTYYAR